MRKKIDYMHRTDEIVNHKGISLNLETGRIIGDGRAFYTVKLPDDQFNFEADTRRGWASMHAAYEKAALFYNSLVPFEASIVPF